MSNTVEQYIAEYKMDRSDYLRGADDIIRKNKQLEDSAKKVSSVYEATQKRLKNQFLPSKKATFGATSADKAYSSFEDRISGSLGNLSQLAPLRQTATILLGVEAAVVGAAYGASKAAADFDSLVKSLEAVDGSSKNAQAALADLKKLALAPGLGFEEGVRAYVGLRNADLDRGFSEKLIQEFANANARAGGGKETFDRIMMAVRQIAVSPNLRGQDLMQLNEANLPVQLLLKKHFGTGDSEELTRKGVTSTQALEGLVAELEKLPRVAGGAKNSLDNLSDALHFALVDIGTGINNHLLGQADNASDVLTNLEQGGFFDSLGDSIGQSLEDALGNIGWTSIFDSMASSLLTVAEWARNAMNNAQGASDWGRRAWRWVSTFGTHWDDKLGDEDSMSPRDQEMGDLHARTLQKWAEKGNRKAIESSGWLDELPDKARQSILKRLAKGEKEAKAKGGDLGDKVNSHVADQLGKIETNTRKGTELLQKQFDRQQSIIGGSRIGGKGITSIELAGFKRAGGAHHKIRTAMLGMIAAIYEYAAEGHDDHQLYNLRGAYAD